MCSSRTVFQNFQIDVVVAKDPMPRVSKKFVMKPTNRRTGPGTRPPAGAGASRMLIPAGHEGQHEGPRAMNRRSRGLGMVPRVYAYNRAARERRS
jgi:hypothetical protein